MSTQMVSPFDTRLSFFSACGEPYVLVLAMKMFWAERVEGKLVIRERKVEACENDFSSESSAFNTAILRPAGARHRDVFATIDPKDGIKRLIVFYHATKVSIQGLSHIP